MAETMVRRILPFALLLGCSSTQGTPGTSLGDESKPSPSPAEASQPVASPEPLPVSDSDLSAVSQSINAFSFDLYGKVAKEPGNLILSPSNIAIALGMTYQGAEGTTADEFASVLHIADSGLAPERWHAAAGELGVGWMEQTPQQEGRKPAPEIALANRLFGAEDLKFKDAFLAVNQRDYRAPMERLNFLESEKARKHINTWVEDRTRDRISDLLPSGAITGVTRLVLANAIYFKGEWEHPFRDGATANAPFFVQGKDKVEVPTMHVTKSFRYGVTDEATWVEMPYAGGRFAMTLGIPTELDGLPKLEAALNAEALDGWLGATQYQRVDLALPKFKLEPPKSLKLSPVLKDLGLKQAFTDAAQFSGMVDPSDDRLKIDEAYHKGFIAVDENGTEAAAATAVVMGRAGAMPAKPVKLDVDRPFMFLIRDTSTGAILFMGRVVDPRA